jgi:hypothetical protein
MNDQATQTRQPKVARQAASAQPAGSAPAEGGEGLAAAGRAQLGQVSPEKIVLSQYLRNSWNAVAPKGARPEDLDMVDGPFNLVARDLTVQDDIRVIAADGSWLADYLVVDTGPTFALARLTQAINLPLRRDDMSERVIGFRFVQAGPNDSQPGWLAVRIADGVLLNAGHHHHRREDCVRFVLDHSTVRGDSNPRVFGKPATF